MWPSRTASTILRSAFWLGMVFQGGATDSHAPSFAAFMPPHQRWLKPMNRMGKSGSDGRFLFGVPVDAVALRNTAL
jgi:hypothetical protein